jgi:hypothetical protein
MEKGACGPLFFAVLASWKLPIRGFLLFAGVSKLAAKVCHQAMQVGHSLVYRQTIELLTA